jgi:hypothetical protein
VTCWPTNATAKYQEAALGGSQTNNFVTLGTTVSIMDAWTPAGFQPLNKSDLSARSGKANVDANGTLTWVSGIGYFNPNWTTGSKVTVAASMAPPPEAAGPPQDNPVAARDWIEAHGDRATLATLHDAIKAFRDSEAEADTSRGREEWTRARGAAHRILAARGSRLALYDARETFSSAQSPLPPGFLEAIRRIGDASCLEPLARAWSATREATWRAQLSDAAREIVARSKLGARNAVVKGIRANWAGFI